MTISELISQLQAIQDTHGPDVLVLRERDEPKGWIEVGKIQHSGMWPMRRENDNADADDYYGQQPDYEYRWASYDEGDAAPAPTYCVYLD